MTTSSTHNVSIHNVSTTTDMTERSRIDALRLRTLHDEPLVLANAWDPTSARLIRAAGANAIATTSGGIAWSLGAVDGEGLTREQVLQALRSIVQAVDVPVSADVEAGYGSSPEEVGEMIALVIVSGASGINLEDALGGATELLETSEQEDRLKTARSIADGLDVALFINARTDVYLRGDGSIRSTLERGSTYATAGADCLFVPGLADLSEIATLVKESDLPINIMTDPGGPSVRQLIDIGVRRVSVGTTLAQMAYATVAQAAATLYTDGVIDSGAVLLDYAELNSLG